MAGKVDIAGDRADNISTLRVERDKILVEL